MSSASVISPYGRSLEHPDTAEPPVPESVRHTGLSEEFIIDLLLKTLYVQGVRTGRQLTAAVRLPFTFVDDRLLSLQQRRLVEVLGTSGPNRGSYLFDLTGAGRDRAREALSSSQYVGPAPVPLVQYRTWVEKQTIRNVHVTREVVREGFRNMVLSDAVHDVLGPSINSAKSLFLYGAPGNGKTMIAETISHLLGGDIFVPFAVEIEGQMMVLYDPVYHHAVSGPNPLEEDDGAEEGWLKAPPTYDQRYVKVRRPIVLTGGELTLDQLDLQYDHYTKMYQAPFQLKANGGVLILDDFGRQRVPPKDLLNRWIVPLEKRIDFLTLHTGGKFPVPFDCLLIISTNLEPSQLVEEAFMRRIHYKILVEGPNPQQYAEIFARCCLERGIEYEQAAVNHIYDQWYGRHGIHARACHPRDILDHLVDIARFYEGMPELNFDMVDRACRSYFLDDSRKE
ncbi:MAG: putative ATPase [Geminicoccaceae bacterium]|nr:putative ATPase [Geminicoccaceae bacterium]